MCSKGREKKKRGRGIWILLRISSRFSLPCSCPRTHGLETFVDKSCFDIRHVIYYHGQKKKKKEPSARFAVRRTLFDLVIMLDDERSAQPARARSSATPSATLPCADCASSSMISDDGTAFFSPRISGMVLFFFLSRVVQVKWMHERIQWMSTDEEEVLCEECLINTKNYWK